MAFFLSFAVIIMAVVIVVWVESWCNFSLMLVALKSVYLVDWLATFEFVCCFHDVDFVVPTGIGVVVVLDKPLFLYFSLLW